MRMRHLAVFVTAAFAVLSVSSARAADIPSTIDRVMVTMSEEEWIESDRPKVMLSVQAAATGLDAGAVRAEILASLALINADINWRFVAFNRSRDATGLDRWSGMVQARMLETELDGLRDRAEAASRPGLQIKLARTDFTPTLGEFEAGFADVRTKIYRRAKEELERLNDAMGTRRYWISEIRFTGTEGVNVPQLEAAVMLRSADAPPIEPLAVSNQIRLTAHVVFARISAPPPPVSLQNGQRPPGDQDRPDWVGQAAPANPPSNQ